MSRAIFIAFYNVLPDKEEPTQLTEDVGDRPVDPYGLG
jgi:hypothetical protein